MQTSKVVLYMQMHKEARHSHGGSKESMSLFSAMLASRYGHCMEMRMHLPALWLSSKHSPPLCMTKGTPCSLSGTSAASSGHVLHALHCCQTLAGCSCICVEYSLMYQLRSEVLIYPKKLALPLCCAHHVLYRSHHLVERANIHVLLLMQHC